MYKPFWTKKFDWVARGGQGRSKYGPEMDSNQSGAVGVTICAWVVSRRQERLSPLKRYRLITGGGGLLPLKC